MTIKMEVLQCVSSLEDARKSGLNVDIMKENMNLMNQTLFEVGKETNSTALMAGVMSYIEEVQRNAQSSESKDDGITTTQKPIDENTDKKSQPQRQQSQPQQRQQSQKQDEEDEEDEDGEEESDE
ncbi:uncharacterized protein LOC141852854 [Brevipalpus obovatus]|uniref:uncharacterized protein LOC141852854 n=1 Tax=Brevipalpus obovatus TaxID=246614 RepID=UPI003D9F188F